MATKDRCGRAQCQSKKTGNIEKTNSKATVGTEEGSENSAILRNVWMPKAMVPTKRRERLGVQRLADLDDLPYTSSGAFALDGTKRFYDKGQG